ncbi:MAG: nitroreductase family protein [Desulfobacterales bacterium]|nr:nitroreductase family protein [Desulfobacterales bacterium]
MFMSLIRKRRSIRRFLDKPVEKEKLDLLVEAGLRAPSSRGVNPWHFVVVTDREMLNRLSQSKEHGSAFLKHAAAGIVVCADATKSDVWVEDASIATTVIHLAAASLDLGSCWIQIRERMHAPGACGVLWYALPVAADFARSRQTAANGDRISR